MDPRERFTGIAEEYRRYRPDYPPALIRWALSLSPGSDVLDVGCGTGISTRAFAAAGARVTGIDPNEAMLAVAREEGGAGAQYRRGEAAATGLPDAAYDLVTVGQAFHWFDLDLTLPELARVLREGGLVVAFWNTRVPGPLGDAYDALLTAFAPDYARVLPGSVALERLRGRVQVRAEAVFPHRQVLDRPGLRGRAWSSSYVRHSCTQPAAFDAALDALFDRHSVAGLLDFPYQTIALAFSPS